MKILVANLGSTSFKFRLFDFSDGERQLARGSIDRIGLGDSNLVLEMDGRSHSSTIHCDGHSSALRLCLDELNAQCEPGETLELDGIGFKAVHGGRYSGVQIVTEDVLDAMSELNDIAPAHNPIYVSAMRELRTAFPNIPLVAAFETGFHLDQQSVSRSYAIPGEWSEDLLIQKWGFHGASHRYISQRIHQLATNGNRVISMHLGGSSSLCAIRDGKSVQTSMGMSPQSGLPQSNRVGDFDPFSLPRIMERTDKTLEEVLALLANESGLLGVSGVSGDMRDRFLWKRPRPKETIARDSPWTCMCPRPADTWVDSWWPWAAWISWFSPEAPERTASQFVARSVRDWTSLASNWTRPKTTRQTASAESRPTQVVSRFGSSPRMKRLLSPGSRRKFSAFENESLKGKSCFWQK